MWRMAVRRGGGGNGLTIYVVHREAVGEVGQVGILDERWLVDFLRLSII